MVTIEISREVWDEIAKRGKFSETEDDVLRRVFGLPTNGSRGQSLRNPPNHPGHGRSFATKRMSSRVSNKLLVVEFEDGVQQRFPLPDRSDKVTLKKVREAALRFARENGASFGQEMAVRKALTQAGYHQTK